MKKSGKNVENARKKVEARPYKLAEATELIKKTHHTKFNETVELAINLGVEDIVTKIMGGWTDYDAVIATPDMMKSAGKLGKVLGPRGLMPNPKTGTVTFDVAKAVKEIKAGKVEYRVDKTSIIHAPIGKVSFGPDKLPENAMTLLDSVIKARPAATKGKYVRSIALSSTMGPGVRVDLASVEGHA